MSENTENNSSNIILYSSPEGSVKVDVVYSGQTFWLTQKRMAELFGVAVPAISKHLKNIFETGELQENSVISKMETTAADGKNYTTAFYSLDAVIAVGYRVNSRQATQFRIWATQRLNEYIIKGFTMDDERLKNLGGGGYWKELLQRISIDATWKRVQVTDSTITPKRFARVQVTRQKKAFVVTLRGTRDFLGDCDPWDESHGYRLLYRYAVG